MKNKTIIISTIINIICTTACLMILYVSKSKASKEMKVSFETYANCVIDRDNLLYRINGLEMDLEKCERRCKQ